MFGYEINSCSDHQKLVYATTTSEYQIVIYWKLILEEFGPNIYHISGVDNIVDDMLRIFTSATSNQDKTIDIRSHRYVKNYSRIGRIKT